eukprot:g35846.t1
MLKGMEGCVIRRVWTDWDFFSEAWEVERGMATGDSCTLCLLPLPFLVVAQLLFACTLGVATRTHMGPRYACLFLGYVEYSLFQFYSGPHPQLFLHDRVPFVLAYYPTNIHIQKIISHHFCHLQQDATTRHIFPSRPLPSFCRHFNAGKKILIVNPIFAPHNFIDFNQQQRMKNLRLTMGTVEMEKCSLSPVTDPPVIHQELGGRPRLKELLQVNKELLQ